MILAKEKGRINLSYNPQGPGTGGINVQTSRSDRVTLSEILGVEAPPPPAAKLFVTEQYRYGSHTNAYYDKDGDPIPFQDPPNAIPDLRGAGTDHGYSTDTAPADNNSHTTRIATGP
jgi:hypothetical protein